VNITEPPNILIIGSKWFCGHSSRWHGSYGIGWHPTCIRMEASPCILYHQDSSPITCPNSNSCTKQSQPWPLTSVCSFPVPRSTSTKCMMYASLREIPRKFPENSGLWWRHLVSHQLCRVWWPHATPPQGEARSYEWTEQTLQITTTSNLEWAAILESYPDTHAHTCTHTHTHTHPPLHFPESRSGLL